jgi:hypothetical protein
MKSEQQMIFLNNIEHFLINDFSNTIIIMKSFIHYSETHESSNKKEKEKVF